MTDVMWAIHNLIAHPISEVCYWLKLLGDNAGKFGDWLHDVTVPNHEEGKGRG